MKIVVYFRIHCDYFNHLSNWEICFPSPDRSFFRKNRHSPIAVTLLFQEVLGHILELQGRSWHEKREPHTLYFRLKIRNVCTENYLNKCDKVSKYCS
jgi:hypothetical protein